MLVNALQKYEPKFLTGLVTNNHLGAIYAQDPILASKLIENIYAVNIGQDIVSYMDRFPTLYFEDDRPYEWMLQGFDEKNIPLIAWGDSSLQPIAQPGLGTSRFFMKFGEKLFKTTDVIVGHKPDLYALRIVGEQPDGANWIYEVELVTGDDNKFIPAEELAEGTRWSKDFSLVPQTLSKEGGETYHNSPFRMSNTMSMIRKQYVVPGDMIVKGQNAPLAFSFQGQDGKVHTQWIKKLDYDFLMQFRREIARLLAYGTSNRRADGTYGNIDNNGFEIRSGAGLYEQISPSNHFFYNGSIDIDWLTEIALGLSVGKLPEDKREFVITTGEYGMLQFHKAVQNKTSAYTPNFTTDRIKFNGGKMSYSGQFLEYAAVNGIVFRVIHDPLKDDPVRNKIQHPNGGLASSYEYTLMDFGTANGEPNIRKVSVKGNEHLFRYIPGLRDPFSPYNAQSQPGMAASSVDGYEVHRGYIGGVMVKNPMRLARIRPAILA